MSDFLQQLINGLTLGCIYGLLALSYTLIFGVLRVINFAIGETMMVGAFCVIGALRFAEKSGYLTTGPVATFMVALCACLVSGILFALLTELIAFRRLFSRRGTPMLLALISSLGIAIFAQNFILHFVDSGNVNFPSIIPSTKVSVWGADITAVQVMIIVVSLVLMGCVSLFVFRTRTGRQIRAVRDNRDLAAECGTNTRRVVIITFAISGLLSGFAGFAIGSYYGVARYNMGFVPGIKAFSAAILGGIGDIWGGVIGGILIGLVEAFGAGYVSAQYKDVIVFGMLILVLLFRPRGLLGRGVER